VALPDVPESASEGVPDIAVIGGGLSGGLLALELASLGLVVHLLDGSDPAQIPQESQVAIESLACASHWSYGAIAPFAGLPWQQVQQRHGDLGWRRRWFRPLGPGAPLAGRLPLPCSRVDAQRFQHQLPLALAQAGVRRIQCQVDRLVPPVGRHDPWRLQLADRGESLAADQVVLAAGAGCRGLWADLPSTLRVSWAGVLLLKPQPGGWPWRGPAAMRLPARFNRLTLEAAAPGLKTEAWQVDPGLLPWGDRWLAGQISLVRPGVEAGEPPDAERQEQRLRQALRPLLPQVAQWPATFQQVPVSFCCDGQPLVGPVAGVQRLWIFAGFSSAFKVVPHLAASMARAVANRCKNDGAL
jgi:glycine/D-amino acid oxidase-like deaminating enzyme